MASVRLASFNKDWHGQVIKLSQSTGFAANGSCVPLWISHSHAGLLSFGQNLDTCMCVCVCDLDLILDKAFKLLSIFLSNCSKKCFNLAEQLQCETDACRLHLASLHCAWSLRHRMLSGIKLLSQINGFVFSPFLCTFFRAPHPSANIFRSNRAIENEAQDVCT